MKFKLLLALGLTVLFVLLPLLVLPWQERGGQPSGDAGGTLPQIQENQVNLYDEGTGETTTIPLKEYLRGALCTEMPHTFHLEALKAQVVCIHSYLLYCQNMNQNTENPASDLVDLTVNSKNWEGYVTEAQARERFGDAFQEVWDLLTQAVEAVMDQVVTYEGEPALTVYCSMSNGRTEESQNVWEAALPYLTSVESPGDPLAQNYESSVSFTKAEADAILQQAFPQANRGEDPAQWIQVTARSPAGYVTQVQVGDQTVTGGQIRTAFSLRSTSFLLEWSGETLQFQVLGYGHGVGMSQYGAEYLAQQGWTYEKILAHYFQGATLQDLAR